ncbi:MAG: S8 family serine peptidase [Verrucomicrobia bacterium]|nr:S8 family serine peptidase [Verrucomicrobiota bacterium]
MKHLRKIVVGGFLLLAAFDFFGTRQLPEQLEKSDDRKPPLTSSTHWSQGNPAVAQQNASFPGRFIPPAQNANQTNSPSALALKHFPKGTVLDSRLEQLSASEFRRTELIETTLKYPFIRLETRFRNEGIEEIILGRHEVVADHVSVELKPGATEAELLAAIEPMGGYIRKKLNLEYAETYLIGLPEPTLDAVPEAIEHLSAYSKIIAEVDGDGVSRKTVIPNDARFNNMWYLHNTGQSGGLPDADIDAAEAWAIRTGSPDVVIAISDTGVNYNHSDLKDNIWTNLAEKANGLDDDRNGYRDDFRGWNFYEGNKDVMDKDGHGTFVAGIIGARGNNGIGISGVSWNCKLMIMRVLDTDGGFSSDIAEGFDYARKNGAKIINASHGGTGASVMRRAVDNLEAAGVLLIAAAGNYSENTDNIPLHPASYPNQNIISVAATSRHDSLLAFSSYGPSTVDLGAPGIAISSTTLDHSYATYSGTSFAAPLVTGVAALLQAQHPGWDCFRIRTRILNNVDKVPSLNGKCTTGGRLNAYKALVPKTTLAEALDGNGFTWTTSGHAPWFGGKIFSHDGVDSAESGKVWHNEESRLETTRTGPGKMSFWWKVSSEPNYDFLVFYVNGSEQARISGATAWAKRYFDLPSGNNTLTWRYVKDDSYSGGMDKAFLDEVIFLGVSPAITSQPASLSAFVGTNVNFSVNTTGTSPLTYQWRKNGANISGATRTSLTLSNVQVADAGNYSVLVSNAAGSAASTAASLALCNVTVSPSTASFDSAGGSGNFGITMTGGCSWSVEKTNSWITLDSSTTGTADTPFHFSVAPNESSFARAGFLTVGNRRFLVRQYGIPAPGSMFGQSISMTVTNASGSLPNNGTFLLATSIGGDAAAFRIVPLTESLPADEGTFSYSRNSSSSATLTLSGTTNYIAGLTFASPAAGVFNLQHESGETQSGIFATRTGRPDFNGDSRNDIVLQNIEGVVAAWCMQGTELVEAIPLRNKKPAATGWKVMAAADLLGNSELEIILQGATGQLAAWCMTNGTNFVKSVFLRDGVPLGAGWKVVSATDFNQDGNADLLLQHQDTRSAVWFMNGTNFLGGQHLRNQMPAGIGWRICGVSDFDGDGENDILWQHQDGRLRVWHFVATEFVAVSNLRTANSDWRAVGMNDFNDDGKDDILFQHKDRRLAVWFMDGTNFISATLLRNGQPLGGTWRIAAPK